ncbi:FtsX-like permease family protein [Pseudoalteromonas sp. S4498]|uniref:ABC transporter permease n=1 Tax=Pseudoalteromonas galatheae TaxID=579562 RepID=UPI00110942CC|nr:ABC transporter permease [Pseudoalteromonas galatheae]NKC21534.1 FtsX-like permease family protein [Pseudoalteromonas galatheae]
MFAHYLDLAWRSLKATPLATSLMALAIAIGIGVTMVSLSVYHMMSTDPIPSKSSKLYAVQLQAMDEGQTYHSADDIPFQLTFLDAKNLYQTLTIDKKVAMFKSGFAVHVNNPEVSPMLQTTRLITREFFAMFELNFLYGGVWSQSQADNAAPVTVIDETIAQKLFGRSDVVGESIYLAQRRYQVVGVTREWQPNVKMYDLNNGAFADAERIFIPFSHAAAYEIDTWGNTNGWKREEINNFTDKMNSEMLWTQFWVELENEKEQQALATQLDNYIQTQQDLRRFNRQTREFSLRNVTEWLEYNNVVSEDNKVMIGLSFMFLAVCLANILGLLLAKFLKRAPDVGVRRALGASKTQVFYQHLVEVALLGFMGGAIGIVFAQFGLWGIRKTSHVYESLATMDAAMLLAAPSIAIVTCILAGLYPAWIVCKTSPATYLKVQ